MAGGRTLYVTGCTQLGADFDFDGDGDGDGDGEGEASSVCQLAGED